MSSKKTQVNMARQPISAQEEEVSPSAQSTKPKRKRRPPAQPWRKPPGFPKRYLSAYNLFFKQERERLLKAGLGSNSSLPEGRLEGGTEEVALMKPTLPDPNAQKSNAARKHARSSGIGFANLARIVAKKWKNLDPELKAPFEQVANEDKERYQREMVVWRAKEEKKKEEEAGGAGGQESDGNHQWGAPGPTYTTGPYSSPMIEGSDARIHQRVDWQMPGQASFPPSHNDGRNRAFAPVKAKPKAGIHGTVHVFGLPPSFQAQAGHSGTPFTPDRKPPAKKSQSQDISPVGIAPARGSDSEFRLSSSFDSSGEQRVAGDAYHAGASTQWEGYEAYVRPHMPPFAIQYTHPGPESPGISYYGVPEYPVHMRHRSFPARPPYSVAHPRYEVPYQVHMPEYSYPTAYYAHPTNPHTQAKYSPPPHYPPPRGKQPTVTPYKYGLRTPAPPRFPHEETLQLHASREDFKVPRTLEPSRSTEEEPKKSKKGASSKESQTKAAKNEDSTILESSLEHIDTNLDTDTVDFLTTLELE